MLQYFKYIWIIFWKDVLVEIRSKEMTFSVFIFSFITLVIFNFAFDPTPKNVSYIAPGILWSAILFGGMLGLNRVFAMEVNDGGWGAILISPVPKDALFFGKVLSTLALMILVESILLCLMIAMFDLQINWPAMVLVSLMALTGFSVLGTLFSAISVFTRAQEVMLPILFLPLISPVIIAAVECSGRIFMGGDIFEMIDWLGLMGALNLLYIVLCPFCFGLTLKE
tara:strand:- start:445 stop:1119 length:675 start_codon:yes stop_codon:yes gene_type:complete